MKKLVPSVLTAALVLALAMPWPGTAAAQDVAFEDDFEGGALSEAWHVRNSDANSLLVDSGKLYLVSTPGHAVDNAEVNLAVYTGALPANYDAYAKFTTPVVDYPGSSAQTTRVGMMLFGDNNNVMQVILRGYCCGDRRMMEFWKLQDAVWTPAFSVNMGGPTPDPITYEIKVEKRSFRYTAYVKNDKDEWTKIGTHAFLGANLKPGFDSWRTENARETITEVDLFRITAQ